MVELQQQVADAFRARPTWPTSPRSSAAGQLRPQQRPPVRRAQAARSAPGAAKGARDLRRDAARIPGISTLCHAGAEPAHRRTFEPSRISVRHAEPRSRRSSTSGRRRWRTPWPRPELRRRQQRPADQRHAGDADRRQGQGELARHHRRSSCARRSIPASAAGRSPPSTAPATATRGDGVHRQTNWTTAELADVRIRNAPASWCRSAPSPRIERTAGSLTINQLGQLPAVTISFNLPPGARSATRWHASTN